MKQKNRKWFSLILIICNFLICIMIIYAGITLVNQNDTNGYFVICIGLQFFIIRSRGYNNSEKNK